MKITVMSIVAMLLTSALIIPVGISYAAYGNASDFTPQSDSTTASTTNQTMTPTNYTSSNGTNTNMTMPMEPTSVNATNTNMTMPVSPNSNQTGTNQTSSTMSNSANNTQAAQQISDFVHQAVTHFQSQKDETLKVVFSCRDQLQQAAPSEIDQIHSGCDTQINSINAKYQDDRNHLQDLIKQYRPSVMVFLMDARGETVDQVTMNNALVNLSSMINMNMSGGVSSNVPGFAATTNNTHCVNPPGGPAIC